MKANHWSVVFLVAAVLALGAAKPAPRMVKAKVVIEKVTEEQGVAVLQVAQGDELMRLWAHRDDVKIFDENGEWLTFDKLAGLTNRKAAVTFESSDLDRVYILRLEK